jgi:hypothetical protein
MRRLVFNVALGLSLCASPALMAQRGIELHGTPASVTSPTVDGRLRGIPASVTDPRAARHSGFDHGHRQPDRDHDRGRNHNRDVRQLYAEPYYGYYAPYDSYQDYDQPPQQAQQEPAQSNANVDANDNQDESDQPSDSSRYGQHYFDGRQSKRESDDDRVVAQAKPVPAPAATADDSPMTTLVYRDGHKSEVRNYAIVGNNLIDLTRSPILKKIPLDSLDLVATRKENEDNGVEFHTP